ncbi:hypothetical protein L226DRAFT_564089 [Lentinus tigrinus ALCF2SS1-7]|uniref:Uncharacterized protein n=1 Tax=Lentinus tigrinus ALCF2SS1-6 TaxID=1328759 RepID=A0A5C2SBZ0_9APHY|nr:hypothetical protein L227DRAFT_600844 [Lentinus tigrinus ALCF2SS1-6]RPD68067.1 hypothetical protein L226DRAFT_564089 [Lentinus tigrinus ALCF2SS1-7]
MWHPVQLLRQLPATAINIGPPSFDIDLGTAMHELADDYLIDILAILITFYVLLALPLLVSMAYSDYEQYKMAQRYAQVFAILETRAATTVDHYVLEAVWDIGAPYLRAFWAGCAFILVALSSLVVTGLRASLSLTVRVAMLLGVVLGLVSGVGTTMVRSLACTAHSLYAFPSKCAAMVRWWMVRVLLLALQDYRFQVVAECGWSMAHVNAIAAPLPSDRLSTAVLCRPSLSVAIVNTILTTLPGSVRRPTLLGPSKFNAVAPLTGLQNFLIRSCGSQIRIPSMDWTFYGVLRACDLPKALFTALRPCSSSARLFLCGFVHLDLVTDALTVRITVYHLDGQSFDLTLGAYFGAIVAGSAEVISSTRCRFLTFVRRLAISAVSAPSTFIGTSAHALVSTGQAFVRKPLRIAATFRLRIHASPYKQPMLIQACGHSQSATLSLAGLTAMDLLAAFRYLTNLVRPSPMVFACGRINVHMQALKFVADLATFGSERSVQAIPTQSTTIQDSQLAEGSALCHGDFEHTTAVPYGPHRALGSICALDSALDTITLFGRCFQPHELFSAYEYGHFQIRTVKTLFWSDTLWFQHHGQETLFRVHTCRSNAIQDSEVAESFALRHGSLEHTARFDVLALEVTPPVFYGPHRAAEPLLACASELDGVTISGHRFQFRELQQAFTYGYFAIHEVRTLFTSSSILFKHHGEEIVLNVRAYQRPLEVMHTAFEDTLLALPSATITEVSDADDTEDPDRTLCEPEIEDFVDVTKPSYCTPCDAEDDFAFPTSSSLSALDQLLHDDDEEELEDFDALPSDRKLAAFKVRIFEDVLQGFQEPSRWERYDLVPPLLLVVQGTTSAIGDDGTTSSHCGQYFCPPPPCVPTLVEPELPKPSVKPPPATAEPSKPRTSSKSKAAAPSHPAQQPVAATKKPRPRKRQSKSKKAALEPSTSMDPTASVPGCSPSPSASAAKVVLNSEPSPASTSQSEASTSKPSAPSSAFKPAASTSKSAAPAAQPSTDEVKIKHRGPRTPTAERRRRQKERAAAAEALNQAAAAAA